VQTIEEGTKLIAKGIMEAPPEARAGLQFPPKFISLA
jgi:hypothetical protein